MKKLLALLLTLMMALSVVPSVLAQDAPVVINIARGGDTTTMDPIYAGDNVDIWVMNLVFEGLVRSTADGKSVEPCLATSWDISEDGLTYTFHLRKDLKWSDGSPLTANDFVYAWQRAVDPATGADYAYMFECIAGYAEAINGEEYVAPVADASSASTSESAAESVSASTSAAA